MRMRLIIPIRWHMGTADMSICCSSHVGVARRHTCRCTNVKRKLTLGTKNQEAHVHTSHAFICPKLPYNANCLLQLRPAQPTGLITRNYVPTRENTWHGGNAGEGFQSRVDAPRNRNSALELFSCSVAGKPNTVVASCCIGLEARVRERRDIRFAGAAGGRAIAKLCPT